MNRIFKRLFDFSLVRWVVNKEKKYHLENDRYLLVVCTDGNNYLFTHNEVSNARERALKNPEDNFETAKYIT